MSDCLSEKVRRSKRIKNLPGKMIVSKNEWDSYYNHFTICVKSLSEYIDVVSKLFKIVEKPYDERLAFRGHSDASSNYKLQPSIARKQFAVGYSETGMINEMIKLRPEEFIGIDSDFDLLSKLQHFGLPTRLLDFTYNPLIALYFACNNEKKADGRVICTHDTSSEFTANTIEKICGLYRYNDYSSVSLDKLVGGVSNLRKYASDTMEPLMAKPKYSNDRLKHQSALFMVFPNATYDYRARMVVLGKKYGNEEDYRLFFRIDDEEEKRLAYIRKEPQIYNSDFSVRSKEIRKLISFYEKQLNDFSGESEFGINPQYHFLFKNRFTLFNAIEEL